MKFKKIDESPFYNYYGGLMLIESENGEKYLLMENSWCLDDERGYKFFGPLTSAQVEAYFIITNIQGSLSDE